MKLVNEYVLSLRNETAVLFKNDAVIAQLTEENLGGFKSYREYALTNAGDNPLWVVYDDGSGECYYGGAVAIFDCQTGEVKYKKDSWITVGHDLEKMKGFVYKRLDITSYMSFVNGLEYEQKSTLYSILWSQYVREDVASRLEEQEECSDAIVEEVTRRYVYDFEYDCNLSYWENIDNLIEKVKK